MAKSGEVAAAWLAARGALGLLVWLLAFEAQATSHPGEKPTGRALAQDVYKGNCLACHQIPGDATAVTRANIGPPLSRMRERFPDRTALRRQIWDATERNPLTVMPPFGKHAVLTEEEIDLIVDYLYQY